MSFSELGLIPEILQAVTDAGYTEPTPIQRQAIPVILAGHDVMGGAQTGTGKTAGFTLPLLNRLARHASTSTSPARHQVRALILAPTRELAMQVYESVKMYSKHLPLRSTCIYGGVDMNPQIQELRRGIEIVVATPGRLLDHVQQKTIALGQVEFLILDEADRMLDMGFLPAIKRVLNRLPKQRQTLLFSATFEAQIKALALEFMTNPEQVQVAAQNTIAQTITHTAHPVDGSRKRDLLIQILSQRHTDQVLVFGKTKHGCNRLAEQLEEAGLPSVAIHGNKSQAARQKALKDFKSGKARILVATDVAARGLDIPDLPLVINHDLPMVAEDYVHRIGRTGRNGAVGQALSLVSPEEGGLLRQIQRLLKVDLVMDVVPGFAPSKPIRLDTPIPKNGGNGGQRPPGRPGAAPRPHARPAARAGHAGQQHRPSGQGAYAGKRNAPRGTRA